jgi:cobalt-zinc-cadmium efflux system protein
MGSHHHHHREDKATGNMRLAFFLNLFFAIIELIGGLYTNSIAILSDAVHDFGDSISLGIAWFLQKKSKRKRDEYYSYGYKRFSLLGAIIISVVLIVSSFFIMRESIIRLFNPQQADAQGMMLFAFLGIAVNGFAAYRMHSGKSFSERAVSLHLLEDVFGWVAVLVASVVMMFVDAPWIDPVLSIGITFWVLSNVYKNLRKTFKVLMQEVPQNLNVNFMLTRIHSIPGVIGLHDFHLWSLDGEQNIMTLHVVTEAGVSSDKIKELKQEIRKVTESHDISHVTLEFEDNIESDDCVFLDNC